jgi:hypothetical protein
MAEAGRENGLVRAGYVLFESRLEQTIPNNQSHFGVPHEHVVLVYSLILNHYLTTQILETLFQTGLFLCPQRCVDVAQYHISDRVS